MQPRRHSLKVADLSDASRRHEIVFYDWGREDATDVVVCVHGLTRNARDFDRLATAIATQGKRVLALNMAGRGESEWLADPMDYHYGTYMADCIAVLDNFHLRNVTWIGTSMGGIIGMLIAAQFPLRITKLILNDIGSFLPKEALKRIYEYVGTMPTRFDNEAEASAYLRAVFAPFNITDETIWQEFLTHSLLPAESGSVKLACDPAIAAPMRRDSQDFTQVSDVLLGEVWEKISIPTLIIRGETSDVLDVPTVDAMRARNVRASAVTVPGVGHAPPLATPEQIAIVTNWLAGAAPIRGI